MYSLTWSETESESLDARKVLTAKPIYVLQSLTTIV